MECLTITYLKHLIESKVIDIVSTLFLLAHETCEFLNIVAFFLHVVNQVLLLGYHGLSAGLHHLFAKILILVYTFY